MYIKSLVLPMSVLVIAGILQSAEVSAQVRDAEEALNLFEVALQRCHRADYHASLTVAEKIRNEYPDEPAGVFSQIVVYQTIMETYRIRRFESKIDSLVPIAIKLANNALKKDNRDGRNYFNLALAYGSRSANYARRGKWLDAFRDGIRVKSNLQKALKYNPGFYDTYYALGVYNYWITVKARVLSVFMGSREKGVKQVELASEKGRFLQVHAMYGLAAIYFNEEKFEKSEKICNDLISEFPDNPTSYYRKGKILQTLGQWENASASFQELLPILEDTEYPSLSYRIDALYQMARCESKLGRIDAAKEHCEQALALEKVCDFHQELDGPYESYSDIKKQLKKLAASLNDKL